MKVFYRDNLNISSDTDQKGLWFHERENHFPRSHPISEGNLLQLKTVTEKHGGYYYFCILGNNSYNCGLLKVEVRVFSKLLSKVMPCIARLFQELQVNIFIQTVTCTMTTLSLILLATVQIDMLF